MIDSVEQHGEGRMCQHGMLSMCDGPLQEPMPRHETTQANLEQLMAQHADKQVVYIGADVHITDLDGEMKVPTLCPEPF